MSHTGTKLQVITELRQPKLTKSQRDAITMHGKLPKLPKCDPVKCDGNLDANCNTTIEQVLQVLQKLTFFRSVTKQHQ